ncbi:aminoglycoside 6-adenylyltransferase [Chloroflexi bacterium TSY]|nr:aminoglycoside 6-adenylyltransferase [Chloroflexi bacterium TSY]
MHQQFIDGLTRKAEEDSRIRALWLEGSYAKGTNDRWSDVDAHVLVPEDVAEDFQAGCEKWLEDISPLVLYRVLFGTMVNAMTADGLRLDIWVHSGDKKELGGKAILVLVDKGDYLDRQSPPTDRKAPPDQAEVVERQLNEFWRMISMLPTPIGRGEFIVAFMGTGIGLLTVSDLLIAQAGKERETGVKHLNPFILEESRKQVEEALQMDGLTPRSFATTMLKLAVLIQDIGPGLAQRFGFSYPKELETAAIRYATRELEMLGLGDCVAIVTL